MKWTIFTIGVIIFLVGSIIALWRGRIRTFLINVFDLPEHMVINSGTILAALGLAMVGFSLLDLFF
ncbi:hypothetical protein ISS37_08805 [candidate division KSB1 bacterium]|nr:hypothetical protein [candidate division KSB1 bacterium]